MNIVITMAGEGSRFTKAGYAVPKYMIESHGKTLFEWAMLSLSDFYDKSNKYIFAVRKTPEARPFIQKMCEKLGFFDVSVIEIDYLTDGQATTAKIAVDEARADEPLMIYNIDTFVRPGAMKKEDCKGEGFIPCFLGEGDHWSFVAVDEGGKAVCVKEKERISEFCTLGAYYFASARLFLDLYHEFFSLEGSCVKGEKYIAPMYQYLIDKGGNVYISVISASDVYVLGTPEELAVFEKEFDAEKQKLYGV